MFRLTGLAILMRADLSLLAHGGQKPVIDQEFIFKGERRDMHSDSL